MPQRGDSTFRHFGASVQIDDSDRVHPAGAGVYPSVGALRLVALGDPATPQRRRTPRRRLVAAVLMERRRAERRLAKPGIDGLLRRVLADEWT